ncbi:MAG: hypothetical protein LQ342_006585 [Letrouitia transgressa]|nr:MAG: hypothetical protein LQ342_006585 [Letrouitia transgressa]
MRPINAHFSPVLLPVLFFIFPSALAIVVECGQATRHTIARPADCRSLADYLKRQPESHVQHTFKFDPHPPPKHPDYVAVPYIRPYGTCALALYVDPHERSDTETWVNVGAEIEEIWFICEVGKYGKGGRGVIGRSGHLVVGMVAAGFAEEVMTGGLNWTAVEGTNGNGTWSVNRAEENFIGGTRKVERSL